MTLQERVAGIQALLDAPPVSESYIIYPGEIPWWETEDPAERRRTCSRQRMRMNRRLHPRRHAGEMREFYEEHPGYNVEAKKRYAEKHPGYMRRSYQTPEGKASLAKKRAKRRKLSTDHALYAGRYRQLHVLQESCANCGAQYKVTHQVDHILALILGGIDAWDNYEPLCIPCHIEKTKRDMEEFRRRQHS